MSYLGFGWSPWGSSKMLKQASSVEHVIHHINITVHVFFSSQGRLYSASLLCLFPMNDFYRAYSFPYFPFFTLNNQDGDEGKVVVEDDFDWKAVRAFHRQLPAHPCHARTSTRRIVRPRNHPLAQVRIVENICLKTIYRKLIMQCHYLKGKWFRRSGSRVRLFIKLLVNRPGYIFCHRLW